MGKKSLTSTISVCPTKNTITGRTIFVFCDPEDNLVGALRIVMGVPVTKGISRFTRIPSLPVLVNRYIGRTAFILYERSKISDALIILFIRTNFETDRIKVSGRGLLFKQVKVCFNIVI